MIVIKDSLVILYVRKTTVKIIVRDSNRLKMASAINKQKKILKTRKKDSIFIGITGQIAFRTDWICGLNDVISTLSIRFIGGKM